MAHSGADWQSALADLADRTSGSGGARIAAAATFNRPADTTAYASGDLVANSVTAGSVTPLTFDLGNTAGGGGEVKRAKIRKSGTTVTNASFRLHLYSAAPVPTNGDNGAWLTDGVANYLGWIDVTVDKAFGDGAAGVGVPTVGTGVVFGTVATLYGLLEARGAYTPASAETFGAELEVARS